MADDLVLAADVVANEEVDMPGFDAPQVQRVTLAKRGEALPSELSDQQDEFISEGLLVPADYLKLKDDPDLQAALAAGDPDALEFATRQVLAAIEATGNEAAGAGTGIQAQPPAVAEDDQEGDSTSYDSPSTDAPPAEPTASKTTATSTKPAASAQKK